MKLWAKILIGVSLAVVLTAAVGFVVLLKRPLATYAWMQRRSLTGAGLEKIAVETAFGRQVAWQGGSGPVIVFIHGAGDQAGTWSKVAPTFLNRYRLIVPDLPGHGDASPAEGPLPLETILGGFGALLDKLAPQERMIIVGNSLGGWIGMLYALDHPERISRLILVNGGGIRGSREDINLMPGSREEARRVTNELRDPASLPVPDFVLDDVVRLSAGGAVARMAKAGGMEKHLLDGRLHEIRVPVDLLWGESDRLLDLDYAGKMRAELPGARLTVIRRCGHVPSQECPEKLVTGLETVLGQPPPAPPG